MSAAARQPKKPRNMPKQYFIIASIVASLAACQAGQQEAVMAADSVANARLDNTNQDEPPMTDTVFAPSDSVGAEHTASTHIDVAGTYLGVLPCADCQGIETTLILKADKQYILERKYLGKSDKAFSASGAWQWINGNVIRLSSAQSTPTLVQVSENKVMMLDAGGSHISGNMADQYILKKVQ